MRAPLVLVVALLVAGCSAPAAEPPVPPTFPVVLVLSEYDATAPDGTKWERRPPPPCGNATLNVDEARRVVVQDVQEGGDVPIPNPASVTLWSERGPLAREGALLAGVAARGPGAFPQVVPMHFGDERVDVTLTESDVTFGDHVIPPNGTHGAVFRYQDDSNAAQLDVTERITIRHLGSFSAPIEARVVPPCAEAS